MSFIFSPHDIMLRFFGGVNVFVGILHWENMTFLLKQWRRKLDNWGEGGGAQIHIFVFTDHQKQSISKQINCAEHEYINMCSPLLSRLPYAIVLKRLT